MRVVAITPSRIDLAGGTLDIYPIYLLEEGALTLNLAISLMSTVIIETTDDAGYHIVAADLEEEVYVPSPDELPLDGPLSLIGRVMRYYDAPPGLRVTTRNDAPAGSGLGSSSALLIALTGALLKLKAVELSPDDIIRNSADIEAQVIGVPTGKQDYYPPLFGGLNAIWFDAGRAERLDIDHDHSVVQALADQLLLVYSGCSRCSAWTNWAMLKNYIERNPDTRSRMHRIRQITIDMKEAIERGDLEEVGRLMTAEWEARRGLAPEVDCHELRQIIDAADRAGAVGRKVCGAGGGGCLVVLTEPDTKAQVAEAIENAGGKILQWQPVLEGISVTVEE